LQPDESGGAQRCCGLARLSSALHERRTRLLGCENCLPPAAVLACARGDFGQ
jgi:hypothetical protein